MTEEQAVKILRQGSKMAWDAEEFCEAYDMAIKALEIVIDFEKAQIITGGRLNGRTYAYKCGLEDGKRKALEQPTTKDSVEKLEKIEQIVNEWNNDASHSFENMCKINKILKE